MSREFDLVVFGATGFTGKFVVEEIAKLLSDKKTERFTWAVAGRSSAKLAEVLKEASDVTGYDVNQTEKVIVDLAKPKTVNDMAKRTSVVLNCVGPYRFYGEDVIRACISEGTHHVDISGEPQFLEGMQLKYHKQAKENGVYIVGACGFDSIPADLGVTFLKQKFNGDVNSVETYLEFDRTGESGIGQASIHYGTWLSAIHGLAHMSELRPIREELFPERLPKPAFKLAQRSVLHNNEIVKGWCVPFLGSDKSIIQRSERYFYDQDKRQPVQIQTYLKVGGLISSLLLMMGAIFFGVMTQFKCGRYLLATFPRLLSLGMVSHEGPTRERANMPFSFTIVGEGWKDKLADPKARHSEVPNKKMIVKVRGINPGYGATCVALIQSGLTILRESDKMPTKGGVYTTGAAFSGTTLIDRLDKAGLTFTVES